MGRKSSYWFYGTALLVLILDQITKIAARRWLTEGDPIAVIPGFFDLRLSFNSGGAFGMLPDWAPLFIIVALVFIFVIVKSRDAWSASRTMAIGLGMLVGGALGNLIDRLISPLHAVTDFLSLHIAFQGAVRAWPTFNLADAGIVIGAILVIIHVYIVEKRK